MKRTLLFATLSMVFALPETFAASELETLRTRCTEQERQIRRLEEENLKLRSDRSGQSAPSVQGDAASRVPAQAAPSETTNYTVKRGDSLERIARRNHCSPMALAKANRLKLSSVIHPGQKLQLPGTAVAQIPSPAAPKPAAAPATGATHKIQAGETYASISRKHRVSIESLVAANPDVKPTALRPGQVIRLSPATPASSPASTAKLQSKPPVPLDASAPLPARSQTASTPVKSSTPIAATRSAPQAATPSPAAAPPAASPPTHLPAAPEKPAAATTSQEQTLSPNPEKKIHSVTIEGEMTYGEFAAKHGTDTSRLNDLNGLDLTNATVLAKGSELYVPAQP